MSYRQTGNRKIRQYTESEITTRVRTDRASMAIAMALFTVIAALCAAVLMSGCVVSAPLPGDVGHHIGDPPPPNLTPILVAVDPSLHEWDAMEIFRDTAAWNFWLQSREFQWIGKVPWLAGSDKGCGLLMVGLERDSHHCKSTTAGACLRWKGKDGCPRIYLSTTWLFGSSDLRRTLTLHELGHALGLSDTDRIGGERRDLMHWKKRRDTHLIFPTPQEIDVAKELIK